MVSLSHYSFALNSPIRTIDADGEFPILINGKTGNDTERGSSSYWDESILTTIGTKLGGFDGIDNKNKGYAQGGGMFKDGSYSKAGSSSSKFWGDFLMVDGNRGIGSGKSNWPNNRKAAGVAQAKADAASVWAKLKSSMNKDGQITEKIEIISHSRGGAFANGYVEQLKVEIDALATKDKIGFAYDKNSMVDLVVHLAPHQSNFINVEKTQTATVGISHIGDVLSGNDIDGDVMNIHTAEDKSSINPHASKSYNKVLGAILDLFIKGGKGAVMNKAKVKEAVQPTTTGAVNTKIGD